MTHNVSWKEYVDAIFAEHRTQVQAALEAHDSRVISNERSASDKVEALRREMTNGSVGRLIDAGDKSLRDNAVQQGQLTGAALEGLDRRVTAQHAEMVLRDSSVREALVAETKSNDVRVREAFAASEKAIQKAEGSTDKRFDSVNAFRAQLAEQAAHFIPREVAETQITELRKQLTAIHRRLDVVQGASQGATDVRTDRRASTGMLVGMISAAVAVIGLIIVIANILTST